MKRGWIATVAVAAVVLSAAAGCGSSSSSSSSSNLPKGETMPANGNGVPERTTIGKGEGQLDLIAWQGYTEPNIIKPFEAQTGCQVHVTYGQTSDQMVTLMSSGNFDGVSASGDATLRLIAGKVVAPIDVKLIKDFPDISPKLQSPPHNTVNGVHYGVSYEWGGNVLMYNTKVVKPAPTSWADVFNGTSYKGKVTAYDSPIYIADAAVYLKAHQPELGIENPYELNEEQFEAAVSLLKEQRPYVGEYWSDATKQIQAFGSGDSTVGTTWQYQYFALKEEGQPVAASPASQGFLPKEGATGWSDTWMISSKAKHPNCMYMWMNWIVSPKANAEVAEFFGEAPAQSLACEQTVEKGFCTKYHAENPAFWKRVYYWETPVADCGNGSSDCMDYNKWVQAWTSIKG